MTSYINHNSVLTNFFYFLCTLTISPMILNSYYLKNALVSLTDRISAHGCLIM